MKVLIGIIATGLIAVTGANYFHDGSDQENSGALQWPLPRGEEREKKLTFGLFVTPDPAMNPIDPPERFTGYHTALDLEIFPEEEATDVPVIAACDGRILQTEPISGYGGVIIQSCQLGEEAVTVLYGHLDYERFQKSVGEEVKAGEEIGFLGEEKTPETGNTRKHLHFGIHRGSEIEVRGYVSNEEMLKEFIDPLPLLQK